MEQECGIENNPAMSILKDCMLRKGTSASKQTQNTSQALQGYKGSFYLFTY